MWLGDWLFSQGAAMTECNIQKYWEAHLTLCLCWTLSLVELWVVELWVHRLAC